MPKAIDRLVEVPHHVYVCPLCEEPAQNLELFG
jgi:hypothetical protein